MNYNKIDISVIVPVYNVEHYLKKCLESILNQTYKNIEVLLIDDGSTDSSGTICDEYSNKDSRIKVIHQNNSGVSAARNVGLKEAKGKYIAFADSDDILPKTAYEKMLQKIDNHKIINARITYISEDEKVIESSKEFPDEMLEQKDVLVDLFEERKYGYLGFTVDKLFDRQIIQKYDIKFNTDIKLNEDRLFVFQYLLHCARIYCSNDIVYYYRQRNEGVITSTRRNKTIADGEMTVITSFLEMQKLSKTYSKELYYIVCRKSFECSLDLYSRVSKQDSAKKQMIKHFMRDSLKKTLKDSRISFWEKIKLIGHNLVKR